MMNKMKYKSGGKKKSPAKKMKMGGNFIEPDKEVKFGGMPKKYGPGGEKTTGMGSTAGRSAGYGSRNAKAEQASKDYYSSLSTMEKLTLSADEKAKLAKERNSQGSNTSGPSWTAEQRQQARLDAQRQARARKAAMDKSNAEMAAEADKRMAELNKNKKSSATTSSSNAASGSSSARQSSNQSKSSTSSNQSTSSSSSNKSSTASSSSNASKSSSSTKSTPKPAAAPKAVKSKSAPFNAAPAKANAAKTIKTGSTASKQIAAKIKASEPTSKKADRINKRAARVEARKNKKSEVSAARARLKAARRLQDGGLKTPSEDQKGLKKLPTAVRNKMGYKKNGGKR